MRPALGLAGGAIAGLLYYKLVGCWTGTCWISGNPVLSAAYFGVLGWVLGGGGQVLARWAKRLRG